MITIKRDTEQLAIYFNEIVHVYIRINELVGVQSWIGANSFFIEYYFRDGAKITCTYDIRSRWIDMLKVLEENLMV